MTATTRTPLAPTVLAVLLTVASHAHAADPEQLEFFEKQVRPLLSAHCYGCHSVKAAKLKANLRVDSLKALLKGGDSGPAIIPGKAAESLLLKAVRYEEYEMPPKGKLPERDIAVFEQWLKMGAPWPDEPEPVAEASPPPFDLAARKSSHWCWKPIVVPPLPPVKDTSWPRDDLDRFILARLEERGFRPAPSVDRRALIRRLSFDLTGLPPTPDEIDAFVLDDAPNAVEKVVDRLLGSPQFGERWGRHWLDLVRYAESRGHEFDNDTPNAWQYRDYVIRALNADVSYDQFVKEHIAGDLLDPPRLNPEKKFNESILGTGFWHLGEWVHSPVDIRKDETDRFDNMLDVMSKTFLGVTVACARCHDHKFDAISQKDYYALSGFLQGSDYRQVPFEALEHNKWLAQELEKIDAEANRKLRELINRAAQDHWGALAQAPATSSISNDMYAGTPHGSRVVFDYRQAGQTHIDQDGVIYGSRPVRPGEFAFRFPESGPRFEFIASGFARSDGFWSDTEYRVAQSANQKGRLESLPRSGRTLRSPTFEVRDGTVHCRVNGSGHVVACVDSHRLIAGPLHGETVVEIRPADPKVDLVPWRWITLNLRRYIGHRVHLEFTPAVRSTLNVQLAVDGGSVDRGDEAAVHVKHEPATLKRIFEVWSKGGEIQPGEAWYLSCAFPAALNSDEVRREFAEIMHAWRDQRTEAQEGISKAAALAPAMLDGSGEDDHLLIRGNSSTPGDIVPRRFLEAIDGSSPLNIPTGSGRLELAQHITSPTNPLTTRVIVNRLWHHLMGRGIVPTVDDFGVLGQRPTHSQLLDYLATEFQKDGQSLKRMIRRIVLSQTYRMSGETQPKVVEADPKNELWHHLPPKRLEGEAIRDELLAVSGRLDRTAFGPSVKVHLTSFMEGRGRPPQSGPLDGANRRSIYLEVRRNFLSPFMLTFDTPNPFSTMGRRNVSNVPAQALILMNDPFVRECAESWARRALKEAPAEPDQRISWLYRTGLGRTPSEQETKLLRGFLNDCTQAPSDNEAWTDVAHAIINTKEFIFIP